MRNIAYLRVSTLDQETSRQFKGDLSSFDKVFEDKATGKNLNRPEFRACMEYLQEGDVLHVHEISRLSRSLDDLRRTVSSLIDKGISVKFHKEGLEFVADASEPMKAAVSKMMLSMLGSIAEFEREMISIRVKEALALKKQNGVKLGASSDKYKKNPNNATKRNREDAVRRAEKLREAFSVIISTLDTPTLKNVSESLTRASIPLPSGVIGEWKPSQVSRVLSKLGMTLDRGQLQNVG
jgi:DNA invertase Pin-like site-specific DNA recombinase